MSATCCAATWIAHFSLITVSPCQTEYAERYHHEGDSAFVKVVILSGGNHGARNFTVASGRADSDHHPARAALALMRTNCVETNWRDQWQPQQFQ
jgi:hypothetical protein